MVSRRWGWAGSVAAAITALSVVVFMNCEQRDDLGSSAQSMSPKSGPDLDESVASLDSEQSRDAIAPEHEALRAIQTVVEPGRPAGIVLDRAGIPLAGASVFLLDAVGALRDRCVTEATGRFGFHDAPESWIVAVQRTEFANRTVHCQDVLDPENVEVRLEPSATLRGEVRDAKGSPKAGIGVLVFDAAIPTPGRAQLESVMTTPDPQYRWMRTDAEGRFEVGGLDPKRLYRIAAGGSGFAMTDESNPIAISQQATTLIVRPLYAIDLVTDAAPRSTTGVEYFQHPGMSWADPEGVDSVAGDSLSALMNEAIRRLGVAEHSPKRLRCFYLADAERDALEPIPVRFAVPGYAPKSVDAVALRAFDGAEITKLVDLERTAGTTGTMLVQLTGDGSLALRDRRGDIGRILIAPKAALPSGVHYFNLVARAESLSYEINELPIGHYDVVLVAGLLRDEIRVNDVEVVPGTPARAALNIPECGNVEFEIHERLGGSHRGVVNLQVSGPLEYDPNRVHYQRFEQPPYALNGVFPGTYRVRAISGSRVSDPIDLSIGNGGTTRTPLVWSNEILGAPRVNSRR